MKSTTFALLVAVLMASLVCSLAAGTPRVPEDRTARTLRRSWTTPRVFPRLGAPSENCTTCSNGETCCGGETCCNGGTYCSPAGSVCCDGVDCDDFSQSCCPDKTHGGVCCEREGTMCCAGTETMASHCCPRWSVCCATGKYGCCFPGTAVGVEQGIAKMAAMETPQAAVASADPTALGLMVIPDLSDDTPMYGVSVDLAKADKSKFPEVTGFNNWGESTRMFAFDATSSIFYLPQANFTGQGNDATRPIHLYSIDPTTGATVSHLVTSPGGDPVGLVTGFALVDGALAMATYAYPSASSATPNGYHFWSVDLSSGAATLLATQTRGAGGSDNYAGWFRTAVSVGGDLVLYRQGFADVEASTGPGLGVTTISGSVATTRFVAVTPPSGYAPGLSLDVISGDGQTFVSMMPASGLSAEIALFKWSINATAGVLTAVPSKVASLGNAHVEPYWGPIGSAVSADGTSWAAMVVHSSVDVNYDLWALATVDLSSGDAHTTVLKPWSLATTETLSGFGIPHP